MSTHNIGSYEELTNITFQLSNTHLICFSDNHRKVPKFWDARKPCCNLYLKLKKRPKLKVFNQNDANGIANSEDPDQTAALGLGAV